MEPIWDAPEAILEELLKDSPKTPKGGRIEGSENVKSFLNYLYRKAESEIQKLIFSREPAAWVRVAMEQLVRWSVIYLNEQVNGKELVSETFPNTLAPIGRYGWRYIIDVSLRHVTASSKLFRGIPEEKEVIQAFSLMTIMSLSSEWSNFFHYFGEEFPLFFAELEPLSAVLMPQPMADYGNEFERRILYMRQKPDWQNLEQVYPNIKEGRYAQILDAALQPNVGFSINDLNKFLDALVEITEPYVGIVVVHSRQYLSEWIADISEMSIKTVNGIVDFAFLSRAKLPGDNRDFLKRSDMLRMLNFAGVSLPRIRHLDALYSPSSMRGEVLTDNEHLLISVPMFTEWIDHLFWSLIHGVRTDLKKKKWFRPALNQLEEYYRKNTFEGILVEFYGEIGYHCIWGLKKLSTGEYLPCGEIDILAYNPSNNTLDIVEVKVIAGSLTFRGWHQMYQDHFTQKKYHYKFLSKLNWVKNNAAIVRHEFKCKCKVEVQSELLIRARFVTKYPNIAKFYVSDYEVMTYEELREFFRSSQPM
ncbi:MULTISPECIES: hypothetical protein [unclassified Coleofasciculus]|uniref:hypothetical protein n=1 Tax=unclassified Coleofasciculus TaxID=2692782 RepID=UPI0018824A7B|nr:MULTISPECIES: hypothetical protein [unclassified Coleofasciculus]MBE9125175.1 hypothetical protein [Coleofasciculus sp. LEGE 07081]MBE9148752.1 hypothetical protein [Coleofasciculus sp. LEGE 07092]